MKFLSFGNKTSKKADKQTTYPSWGISVMVAQCQIEKYILLKIYTAKI